MAVIIMAKTVRFWSSSEFQVTLKAPAKMHLKILSAQDICCLYLLTLLTNVRIEANSVDPYEIAATGAV